MISNYKVKPQQEKPKQTQLNTCLIKSIKLNSSPLVDRKLTTSLDSNTTEATMSSMTADLRTVAAAAAAKTTTRNPPMEAVVVNSIIYSKPSFCSIVVDLGGGSAVGDNPTIKDKLPKLINGDCPGKTEGLNSSSMAFKQFPVGFASACLTGFSSPPPSVAAQQDAQLYRMCTTMNGSIHHQISDLCDNLMAMAGFFASEEHNDNDDDDLVEFVYDDGHHHYVEEDEEFNTDDESEEDEDEDEETETDDDDDDIDIGYYNNHDDDCLDNDNDTVDFSYGFSTTIFNPPKINCDKGKKVRFNTKPTVHVMHTWDYAYRAARKGQWEMYARDRERFRLRVQRASLLLNPILNQEHRQKIYEQRFVTTFDTKDDDDGDKDQKTPVHDNNVKVKPIENESSHKESKNLYQKKKVKRRKRFCKMGNKHYF